jgi:ParB-like chromosome segregation protein Spo0J
MSREESVRQLELLPSRTPKVRRATLPLADLAGFEHATPDAELVELIAKLGLLQPVVVTEAPRAGYRIIEGRRRAKAIALLAEQARWPTPARIDALIVRGFDEEADVVPAGMTLALHASRGPSPASELAAIEAILAHGSEEAQTIKEIAAQTGMPVQTVRRRLRLRNLAPRLRAAFDAGDLTLTVAEVAARLTAAQQAQIEAMLDTGERVTLATVRDLARARTANAATELPAGMFADRETTWQVQVTGHLRAALQAIPTHEPELTVAELLESALALMDTSASDAAALLRG